MSSTVTFFHVLATVNNAAMDVRVQVSLMILILIILDIYSKVTPVKMAIIKQTQSVGKDTGKLEPLFIFGENVKCGTR